MICNVYVFPRLTPDFISRVIYQIPYSTVLLGAFSGILFYSIQYINPSTDHPQSFSSHNWPLQPFSPQVGKPQNWLSHTHTPQPIKSSGNWTQFSLKVLSKIWQLITSTVVTVIWFTHLVPSVLYHPSNSAHCFCSCLYSNKAFFSTLLMYIF